MKEYKLNLNDIEEVESSPRRRRHNHQINSNDHNNHNNYKEINNPYEQDHLHHHYNNTNNHKRDINRNSGENQNYNHQRKHRNPEWTEFGCKQILLMTIFMTSILVLFLSFFINLILTIKQVITPRFFLPSIILIFLSFMFAGGIMGTYIEPPNSKHKVKFRELLMMRTLIPVIIFNDRG